MYKRSMLIWLSIVPLAILNGGLRINILEPNFGEKLANPISCFILCCLIFIVSFVFIPKLGKGTNKIYIKMGVLWVFSTIIMETIIGLIEGMTFYELLNAYNISTGNFWLVVVIFIGFGPWLVAKIKKLYE